MALHVCIMVWAGTCTGPRDTVTGNPGEKRSTESMSGSFDDYNQKAVTVSTVLGAAAPSVCSSLCVEIMAKHVSSYAH